MVPGPPDADSSLIDNDEAAPQVFIVHAFEQPREGCLGILNRRRPNPKANHAGVGTDWIHAGVGEVLVESDDDRLLVLRPLEDCIVGRPAQSGVASVLHLPQRFPLSHEFADSWRNVLIE